MVIGQNLVDDRLERARDLGGTDSWSGALDGFRMLQDMPDRVPRVIGIRAISRMDMPSRCALRIAP